MNSNSPLISVIIPTYNSSGYILKTLQELEKQTYENFEAVIINDGSDDNTLMILKAEASKNNRLKVVEKENGGVSSARNAGLKHAQGEFITFLDDDDRIEPDFLFKMYSRQYETGADAVYCGMYRAYDGSDKGNVRITSSFDTGMLLYKFLIGRVSFHLGCLMINRKYIEDHDLYFDERLRIGEDLLYIYKLLSLCKMISIPEYMYYYVCRSGSVMNAKRDSLHYQHEAYAHELIRDEIIYNYAESDREEVCSFLLVSAARHKIRYLWKLLLLGDFNLLSTEVEANNIILNECKYHQTFDKKTKKRARLLKTRSVLLWRLIRIVNRK